MIPVIRNKNGRILLDNAQLQTDAVQFSYLAEPAVVGDATIFLQDYTGFATNQAVLIEDFGSETAEIVTLNGAPTVGGGAVTTAVLVRSHPVGAKVYILEFDQVELSHATTATGSKTVLTLNSGIVAIQPDIRVQIYNETEFSSGYYFARYKHSISGLFSGYSDALVFGGWASNTVGYMIDRALADLSEKLSEKITRLDCYEWINTGIRLIQGKLKRWPEHYSYNAVLGQVTRGTNVLAMPTDAYDLETNKSIIALRHGTSKKLEYLSPGDFDTQMDAASQSGVAVTQVTTQATSGQTTLTINNSYDYADSGSVHVYVSGVKYSITYTGVTRSASAGVLTGVPASGTGSISITIPASTYVWQNEIEGTPLWFTVRNSNLEWWPLADAANDNVNVYADYAKVATSVDSDGDVIDLQRFDILQDYLTWRIECKAKKNGVLEMGVYYRGRFSPTGFYAQFTEKLNDAIKTLPQNNRFPIRPAVNRIGNTRNLPAAADLQDLAISDQ